MSCMSNLLRFDSPNCMLWAKLWRCLSCFSKKWQISSISLYGLEQQIHASRCFTPSHSTLASFPHQTEVHCLNVVWKITSPVNTCLQNIERFRTYHGAWLLGRALVQDSVSCQYLFEVLLEVFELLINPRLSTPPLACKARHGWNNITANSLEVIGKWTLESYLPTSQEPLSEMEKCEINSCLVSK